jgi:hypothetical protein
MIACKSVKIGDRVSYNDVNLILDKGTVIEVPENQNRLCLVKWDRFPNTKAIEYIPNLRLER